jgi:hypothetical protein
MGIEDTQKIEILPVGSKTVDCAAIIQWAKPCMKLMVQNLTKP